MSKQKLTISFEGLPNEEGEVRLEDFINVLQSLYEVTAGLDKEMSANKTKTFYFRVVGLSFSSPYLISVEPHPINHQASMNLEAIRLAINNWDEIGRGNIGRVKDPPFLERTQKLIRQAQKGTSSMKISYGEKVVSFTPELKASVDLALTPSERYEGQADGVLEYFNIHGTKSFRIYSDVEPKILKCTFPNELMEKAKSAIGKRIEVKGILEYRAIAQYPHKVEVHGIDIFPDDKELPTIWELRGEQPEISGNVPVEELIRELRDATKT